MKVADDDDDVGGGGVSRVGCESVIVWESSILGSVGFGFLIGEVGNYWD